MVFQNTVFQNTVFQKRPFNSGLKYDHSLRTVILNQNPTRHAHEIHTAPAPSNLDQVLLGWKDGRSTKPLYQAALPTRQLCLSQPVPPQRARWGKGVGNHVQGLQMTGLADHGNSLCACTLRLLLRPVFMTHSPSPDDLATAAIPSAESPGADASAPPSKLSLSGVLSAAARLWLRSQADSVSDLQIQIHGRTRQLLSGCVPGVSVAAEGAVYRGVHLSQLELTGSTIRVNLKQVLRGKPLQLLEPILVDAQLAWQAEALTASLAAPWVAQFVDNLLTAAIAPAFNRDQGRLNVTAIGFDQDWIGFRGQWHPHDDGNEIPSQTIQVRSHLQPLDGRNLKFTDLQVQLDPAPDTPAATTLLPDFVYCLGTDVTLSTVAIVHDQLQAVGQIWVRPGP